jgi:2'-5' RNA ligase
VLRSALIVEVPEAEPLVGAWRAKHDWSAQHGVPAHITVLFPFVETERIDGTLLEELRTLFAGQAPIEFSLTELRDFPDGTLWLAPEPAEHFRRLTELVVERWPDYPPYEGLHDVVMPHLTIADGESAPARSAVEAAVASSLPLQASANAATMITEGDDGMWSTAHRFPLGAG